MDRRARRCLSVATTGLKLGIERRALGGVSCFIQDVDLGVGATEMMMSALSHDLRV